MFHQAERIGLRRRHFVIDDSPVRRRLQMIDHPVFVDPLILRIAVPADDRVSPILRRDQDRIVGQLDEHEVDRPLHLPVGPRRLDLGERRDQVDGRDVLGNAIGQEVARPRLAVPRSRFVFAVREEDAGCAVLVAVDEHEINRPVFGMAVPEAVLPHRKAQAPTHPGSVRRQQPRFVEEFVGQIVVRKVFRPTAVMAVIAAEDEIRPLQAVPRFDLVHHLADQEVRPRNDPPRRAELTPAVVVVAHRVGFGEPDDGDAAISFEQKILRVIGVRLVHVAPRIVVLKIRDVFREAPRPRNRRKLGHDRERPRRPVVAVMPQVGVKRRDAAGLLAR